jgi:hypothetical protein
VTGDARFEDGAERPLRLRAGSAEDLAILSALIQDAVAPVSEIAWARRHRRFAMLINRFRWEDAEAARRQGRPFERVRSMLVVEDVLAVRSSGVDPADREMLLSLLSLGFEPTGEGGGALTLTLAGDGAIALEVEWLDVTLTDVTRPYLAPSGKAPAHPDG